jgi:drug/metabolite transporter (DMT)-like permease
MSATSPTLPRSHLFAAIAVALCGSLWGVFWLPLRWLDGQGVGGGWTSLIFNLVSMLAPLPFLMRRAHWAGFMRHAPAGLMLGTAFALYTVALVLTDVLHAILLFYLTPVWSTLGARLLFGTRLTSARLIAIGCGAAGMALILGVTEGIPLPRNPGDWVALASGMLWAAGTMHSFARPAAGIALPVFTFALGGALASGVVLAAGAALAMPMAAANHLLPALPAIIAAALIFFVPPNFLVLWAAQRLDPGRIGILLTTEVLVGAISAALLSGESFGPAELAGTALIISAGLVEVLGRR